MERLLINKGRYHGECIDIQQILSELQCLALQQGWSAAPVKISEQKVLPGFKRNAPSRAKNVYISSGIHGDEPAGPLAILRLFQENLWPPNVPIWVVPCLNPEGFIRNCREDEFGIDLNRDYRFPKTETVRAHIAWLQHQPTFYLTLLLHEDWEANGFYLYELNPDHLPSLAPAMINQIKEVCPVDTSPEIEGRPAQNGIISANPDLLARPDWPEAFYLIHHKTRLSYTLEAPSDFALSVRVSALVAGVTAALQPQGSK